MKSSMVRSFPDELRPCLGCGFLPVRHEVTHGEKRFCFWCPNWECASRNKSPALAAWSTRKQDAAKFWNATNDPKPNRKRELIPCIGWPLTDRAISCRKLRKANS